MIRAMPDPHAILRDVRRYARKGVYGYAGVGGYPAYVYTTDGDMLCPACVRENYREISDDTHAGGGYRRGWRAYGVDIYWEGPDVECGHCASPLSSAYGDPDPEPAEGDL